MHTFKNYSTGIFLNSNENVNVISENVLNEISAVTFSLIFERCDAKLSLD